VLQATDKRTNEQTNRKTQGQCHRVTIKGRGQGHVTIFYIWDPLRIFETSKDRHFKFDL